MDYGLVIDDNDFDYMCGYLLSKDTPLFMNNIDKRLEEKKCKLVGTPRERIAKMEQEFNDWAMTEGYIEDTKYGYCKNHKKRVKAGQTRTRERKREYKSPEVPTNRNSSNTGRNTRRAYVQEKVVEGSNAQNETGNVQRTLRTSSSGNTSTITTAVEKDIMLGIVQIQEYDFLFDDASRMEEFEELSANICLIA
ncbi:hypothetical protein Tco_0804817 [Tanacetum coccineum]|uniref:Uncharacterized protein n=1 Tax=Tanacetum coccineum TaxID=301880 RepID=A0ABQ5A5C1_9ASTR